MLNRKLFLSNIEAKILPFSVATLLVIAGIFGGMFIITQNKMIVRADPSTDFDDFLNITFDATQVTGSHAHFPLLIYNSSCTALSGLDSNDFSFFDGSGNELYWDLVNWNDTSDTLECYVNLSENFDGNEYIHLWYGSTNANNNGGENNPTGVYDSNFIFVYHFNETSGNFADSTSNSYTGNATNLDANDYTHTGQVGEAIRLDGVDTNPEHIEIYKGLQDNTGWQTYTFTAWIRPVSVAEQGTVFDFTYNARARMQLMDDGGTYKNRIATYDGAWKGTSTWFGTIHDDVWQFVASRTGSNTVTGYNNASSDNYAIGTMSADNEVNLIGCQWDGSSSTLNGMNGGMMDECWLSSVDRGDNWVNTFYNMQNNKTTFTSFNDESDASGSLDFLNSPDNFFTTSGLIGGNYYANNTGSYYETAKLSITIVSTNIEYIRVNVSDIDASLPANNINISFDDDNSAWSGNWHQCSAGTESIIVNGTNWGSNNWMSGTNPFTADSDGDGYNEIQSNTDIYWRVRVNYPNGIATTTYSKTDMTWDAGTYS